MTDPLLHSWLLEIATQPPEAWYGHGRLALADWLEERGDSRADAVRDEAAVRRHQDAIVRLLMLEREAGHISDELYGDACYVAYCDPVAWNSESTDRERQRLLSLFPEVTLTGPCPCHEPLPAGASVLVVAGRSGAVRDTLHRFTSDSCMTCGNSGVRTARAADWLVWRWTEVAPRTSQRWDFLNVLVLAGAADVGFRLPMSPADQDWPLLVLPATNLVGEPL